MDKEIIEIRKLIDDWYSFQLNLGAADIMPYVVYLMEAYDRLTLKLESQNHDNN